MKKEYEITNARGNILTVHADLPDFKKDQIPFVIAVHGLDSNYHEYGLYDAVAEQLSQKGIACFRIDFPGCGESCEDFRLYTHKNMLDDMESVLQLAVSVPGIDRSRFGVQGYSMGGRVTSLFTERHPKITAISLWAPGISNGLDIIKSYFSKEINMVDAYSRVEKTGTYKYNPFGVHELCFSKEFFSENRFCNPLVVLNNYTGSVFLAYGKEDQVVNVADMEAIQIYTESAKDVRILAFDNGGHDFGTSYGRGAQNEVIKQTLIKNTVDYFCSNLCSDL